MINNGNKYVNCIIKHVKQQWILVIIIILSLFLQNCKQGIKTIPVDIFGRRSGAISIRGPPGPQGPRGAKGNPGKGGMEQICKWLPDVVFKEKPGSMLFLCKCTRGASTI